jgi:uncharacterized protein (TIGR03435 family)
MKSSMKDVDEALTRDFEIASDDEATAAGVRVRQRLETSDHRAGEFEARLDSVELADTSALRRKPQISIPVASAFRRKVRTRRVQFAAAAVFVLAAVLGTAILRRPADTELYRIVEGYVRQGDTIRSNGGGGAVLELADTSRIEMRSNSELSLERASDGLRIRLTSGGIIVNAAKQRTGHLYVQTKDMTVSVVGTVFVVNADDTGSRVAVIEGEVRVQQGATETKLRPGEQVATDPRLPSPPVVEEIAWSRNAAALIALLQPATAPRTLSVQIREIREAFEEVSIRPAVAGLGGGRGSGVGLPFVVRYSNALGCSQGAAQIDRARFAYYGVTAYTLIVHAYGDTKAFNLGNCVDTSRVAPIGGGPDWVRSDQWDIQAKMPAGASTDVESVRRRVQTLLAERFKLQVRRGTREVPAYALTVAGDLSRYAATADGATWLTGKERFPTFLPPDYTGVGNNLADGNPYLFFGKDATVADLMNVIVRLGGRPVLDRTGISGRFNFAFTYPIVAGADGEAGGLLVPLNDATWSSFRSELQRQLGFRLEESKSVVDAHAIERVERPTEN